MGSSCDDCVNYLAEIAVLQEQVHDLDTENGKLQDKVDGAEQKLRDIYSLVYDLYRLVK